ncbi:hypothetical protein BSKO_05408 [Bryopsis sp. KO-2023]|nr:hypothetical protein BSKO_05408 [Bryopsis sp. KO-2023]
MAFFPSLTGAWRKVADGFASLKGSPRNLYLVYVLKVLESFGYFSLSMLYTLLLTDRFGIDDYPAGISYGIWGGLITGYNLIFAPLIDHLGVKKSLLISFTLSSLGRLGLAFATSRPFLYFVLYGPIAMGNSLGVPVMVIGIKRSTSSKSRPFAFGMFYTLMNVAALINGAIFDFFHITFINGFKRKGDGARSTWNDGLRLLVLLGCLTSVVGFVVACFLKEDGEEVGGISLMVKESGSEDGEARFGEEEGDETGTMLPALSLRSDGRRRSSATGEHPSQTEPPRHPPPAPAPSLHKKGFFPELWSVVKSSNTRKFILFCLLTVNLKQIFRHLDATLPKYELRAFGCQTPVGWIYSINPFMVITLVPFVGALTAGVNHFDMIHFGSYISALSAFWMVAFQKLFAAGMFVVFLSLGEAIWSPRWYDYSMWIAPHGKEGIFTALAAAPLFLAKLPTGMLSGKLLQAFCPDNYECQKSDPPPDFQPRPCDGKKLWLIVGCITMLSPIGLFTFRRWLRVSDSDLGKGTRGEGKGLTNRPLSPRREIEMINENHHDPDFDLKL